MPARDPKPLTKLELDIMQVIWRLGPAGVSAVQQGLEQPLAYTTVQTMLNILVRKGHLLRRLTGRAYAYSANVTQARASRHALGDLIERMFGGSSEALVMSLVKNRQIDTNKLAELSRRLAPETEDEQ